MPAPSIRLQHLNKGLQSLADHIVQALQTEGIDCSSKDCGPPAFCTLITFNDGTDPDLLHTQIAQARQQYGNRVLVVNLNHQALSFDQTWILLCAGAQEILNWNSLTQAGHIISARIKRWHIVEQLLDTPRVCDYLTGNSRAWRIALRDIAEVALFSQAPLLIMGESGTGKELVARLIHELDPRPSKQNLVLLDCSSISSELSGSEFFGHEKGAFTNAISTRDGAFCLADRGTLFLDEVGELPPRLQAELLRVIQEGTYKRVGSNTWQRTNFRLICATNRKMRSEVNERHFREDLFYRVSTWEFTLPPLRERREDIPELARFFLRQALQTKEVPDFDPVVLAYLETRDYPGNIRELRQLITRIAARHVGPGPISVGDIAGADRPRDDWANAPLCNPDFVRTLHLAMKRGWTLKEIVADVSNTAKDLAIQDASGNLQLAAEMLNVTDRTLQNHQAYKKGQQWLPEKMTVRAEGVEPEE